VSLLLAACAAGPASEVVAPGPLRVRIGPIDPVALETAAKDPPRALRDRTGYLVDLLWEAGCAAVELPRDGSPDPDVACSLPGRTSDRIVVLAHLDRGVDESGMPRHWRGASLLPSLYRALGVEERQHSFEFAAFGRSPRRSLGDTWSRQRPPPPGEGVRAVVEILDLDPIALAFASTDDGLSQDFVSAGLAVGRPLDSLLRVTGSRPRQPLAGVPTIAIASPRGGGGSEELPAVAASRDPATTGYHSAARLIAVYLGYLDETLRVRAGATPSADAGTP
jgi:hypothetical protein